MSMIYADVELTSISPAVFAQPMPRAYPITLVCLKACAVFEGRGEGPSGHSPSESEFARSKIK